MSPSGSRRLPREGVAVPPALAAAGGGGHELRHPVHAPVEVLREDAVPVHVGRGGREIDGGGDGVLARALDRVHDVAERDVQGMRAGEDLLLQAPGEERLVVLYVAAPPRVVLEGEDVLAPDADA